jgi:hypothetical protein
MFASIEGSGSLPARGSTVIESPVDAERRRALAQVDRRP